jgi:hypothetical protein
MKMYCDQINSNITTQFLTEHLLTLQDFFTSVQYGCQWLCGGRHPDYSRGTIKTDRRWWLRLLMRILKLNISIFVYTFQISEGMIT